MMEAQIQQAYQLAQTIDIELSHMIWAAVITVVGFFLKRELKKIDDHISSFEVKVQKVDDKTDANTIDIVKIKGKLDLE